MKTYEKVTMSAVFILASVAVAITAATEKIEKPRSRFHLSPELIENGTIKGAPLIMQQTPTQLFCSASENKFNLEDTTEQTHCKQCQLGVYSKNKDGFMECSYCERLQTL